MMSDPMVQQKRQVSDEIAQSRRAQALLRPFVPLFEDWNQRAARASAIALSRLSSADEREQQAQLLRELLMEVEAKYDEFESAVAGEPAHSRIEDLRSAFQRLRAVLKRTL